jgi:hypothetical protein
MSDASPAERRLLSKNDYADGRPQIVRSPLGLPDEGLSWTTHL